MHHIILRRESAVNFSVAIEKAICENSRTSVINAVVDKLEHLLIKDSVLQTALSLP